MANSTATVTATNKLYYGDNLHVLREHVANELVDLIYLDPPFNSKRDYNLLFKTPKGFDSDASITAFEDAWHWAQQAEDEFKEIVNPSPELMRLRGSNTDVADLMRALFPDLSMGGQTFATAKREKKGDEKMQIRLLD